LQRSVPSSIQPDFKALDPTKASVLLLAANGPEKLLEAVEGSDRFDFDIHGIDGRL